MYATAAGQTDAPPSVGREFVDASHGVRGLPARIGKSVGKRKKKAHSAASNVRHRIGKPKRRPAGDPNDRSDSNGSNWSGGY